MKTNLGLGVMINMLCGNEKSVEAFSSCLNKTIKSLSLSDNSLHFTFDDGTNLTIWDNGQSCCETRYIVCDDDLKQFIGAKLIGAEIKDAPNISAQYEEHEIQFLDIKTSLGVFQCASHNEHNGYYGGFSIECKVS